MIASHNRKQSVSSNHSQYSWLCLSASSCDTDPPAEQGGGAEAAVGAIIQAAAAAVVQPAVAPALMPAMPAMAANAIMPAPAMQPNNIGQLLVQAEFHGGQANNNGDITVKTTNNAVPERYAKANVKNHPWAGFILLVSPLV